MLNEVGMKSLFVALVFAALTGCAPETVADLRNKHAGKLTFEIEKNYQPVYRSIIERARSCFEGAAIAAQEIVQGDLYTDLRSGNVSVAMQSIGGVNNYLTIDITALSDNSTKVETYYAYSGQLRTAQVIEKWVRDGSNECR
jgi:hypothetical protein